MVSRAKAQKGSERIKNVRRIHRAGLSTLLLHGHRERPFSNHARELVVRHGYIHP